MPLQFPAASEQRLAKFDRLDEPLTAGHDFERTIALLVKLHRVGNRTRLPDQIAGLAQLLDDLCAGLRGRQPSQLIVVTLRPLRIVGFPAGRSPLLRPERAIGLHHRTHRQMQLAPPGDVGDVAERANHRDAAALGRIGQRVRLHRHPDAKERRRHLVAKQRPIPLIVGMRDERDARRNQFRTGRLDFDGAAGGFREPDAMIGARQLAIFEFGLRDGGLEIHIPERRRFDLIRETSPQQAKKCELRDALRAPADRRVRHRPVDREAEVSPQTLERFFVFGRQAIAELDEIRPRHRDRRLWPARLAGRTRDRTAATDRSERRSSSARGVRSAIRCHPIPSDRTRPCRACAGSARSDRCGCTKTRDRRGAIR